MELVFDLLRSVIYGVIEGITEWLPISSTGNMILAEQVRTLDKQRLTERLGALPESVMAQVDRALLMSLGIGARTDY